MRAPNPWSMVPAAEYEAHMGPAGVDHLAPLSAIFGKIYGALRPARVLVLGVATGNGLEHVDLAVTRRVVGVDVNIQYVAVARQRHLRLGPALELYCEDALHVRLAPGSFDLVHAALLFEHVDRTPLVERIARWLAPGGACSAVVELPGERPAAASAALRAVSERARAVAPAELRGDFERERMVQRSAFELPAGSGRFHVALFSKPAARSGAA
jgi:SAM-dependent methyltransferase